MVEIKEEEALRDMLPLLLMKQVGDKLRLTEKDSMGRIEDVRI